MVSMEMEESEMDCENEYCIYWDKEQCTLSATALDFRGMCKECMLVSLSDEELFHIRRKDLETLGLKSDK